MVSRSSLPVVQLLAQLQHALAVVRVQVLHPELEAAEALLHVRGNAADVAKRSSTKTVRSPKSTS